MSVYTEAIKQNFLKLTFVCALITLMGLNYWVTLKNYMNIFGKYMAVILYRTINMKNIVKTIFVCNLFVVFQGELVTSAFGSDVLEEVLAEQTPGDSFKHYYSLWASDSDDDAEKARAFFRVHADNPNPKYAKEACSILISGNDEDKSFVLPHVRAMQSCSNAKIATWAASLLLASGTLADGEIAIGRLKELVQSKDVTVSSLAVYELFIRHEIDFDVALDISKEATKSDDDHVKLAGARVLNYMVKSCGFEFDIDDALKLLRVLVKSADSEISSTAAEILAESSSVLEDRELILTALNRMAEDPRGPEAGIAAWYFNSEPFSDKEKALGIARIRLANPRLRCSKDALILILGGSDQELVRRSLKVLLDDSNRYNSFLAAAYFFDYGEEKDKICAIAAFEKITKDLNFPFNSYVVEILIHSDFEGVYGVVANHVMTVIRDGKGNPFLRRQYLENISIYQDNDWGDDGEGLLSGEPLL